MTHYKFVFKKKEKKSESEVIKRKIERKIGLDYG
jgi:predicted CopG family antitoxin